MTLARDRAIELIKQLRHGDNDLASMQLALFIEKSLYGNNDDRYRDLLPPELAHISLSPDSISEIIDILLGEIRRDPTEPLLATLSFADSDVVVRAIADIMIRPPRPLTVGEIDIALPILTKFLPHYLAADSAFLPKGTREHLRSVVANLLEAGEPAYEKTSIRHFAPSLLTTLT